MGDAGNKGGALDTGRVRAERDRGRMAGMETPRGQNGVHSRSDWRAQADKEFSFSPVVALDQISRQGIAAYM
jgi:hypothetical protein